MKNSGIYIVTLKNEELIPSQLNDYESLMVNKDFVKYGQSGNLANRQQSYEDHFGRENVHFKVVFQTDRPVEDEAKIAKHLKHWKCKSPKNNQPLEWLEGINPEEVEKIIIQKLTTS